MESEEIMERTDGMAMMERQETRVNEGRQV